MTGNDEDFTFEVTVRVSGWPGEVPVYPGDDETRTARDYAEAALFTASLREARSLDGFADLDGPGAWISHVETL